MYFSPKSENLYIIGNGFDLYLGLKTSYNDFFEDRNYISIRKNIQKKIDSISLIENNLKKENEIRRNFNTDAIEIYGLFLLYLLLEEDSRIINWNDVEKKILSASKKVRELSLPIPSKILHNNKEEIRNEILEKVINKKTRNNRLDFLKDLNKFEKEFGDYIKEINEKVFTEDVNSFRDNKFIDKIHKVFQEDKNKINIVINFNYTTYLKKMDYISEMTNVHGTFENPIFGIDNTEIGNDREFYYLTKTSRVLFNNTIKKEFKLPNNIEISKICFFGHSLARADYSYFQSIFDYYDIYNSEVKLEFKYYNYIKNDEKLTDEEKEERKDEVKSNMHKGVIELMNDYGNTISNKSRGQNLLHKLILENRIKIVEVE